MEASKETRTVSCPGCGRKLRPCNLERHYRTHLPVVEQRNGYVKFLPARRPLPQSRGHDRRYDEFCPRGDGPYRFRIYRLRVGELQLLGAAPTTAGFGRALYDFHDEGEFIADDSQGVLDTVSEPGSWIVHPFTLGRMRAA